MKAMLVDCLWQKERLGVALQQVAKDMGRRGRDLKPEGSISMLKDGLSFEDWLDAASSKLGLEADPIDSSFGDADRLLQYVVPAIFEYKDAEAGGFLVLLRKRGRNLFLLKPDCSIHRISLQDLKTFIGRAQSESLRVDLDTLLEHPASRPADRKRMLDALLAERLKTKKLGRFWRLRGTPGSHFWEQLRHAGAIPLLLGFFLSHAATYAVLLLFWGLLGNIVFTQTAKTGSLWLLAGLLLVLAPLRLISPWLYGILSIRVGERLKQRLLYGALRLEPDEIRHQGVGGFLGRVIETEAIETSAMRGSGNIFMGLIQLVVTVPYLTYGAGGWLQVTVLGLWLAISVSVAGRYFAARLDWTNKRLFLTTDLVEQLLGYRTRLAQQPRAEWHTQEEQLLADYDRQAAIMDRRNAWLKALMPRGWTLVGLLALVPALMTSSTGAAEIAIAISGVLFASLSFQQIAEGLTQFSDAWVAWDQVSLLFDAAGRPLRSMENAASDGRAAEETHALLAGQHLGFRYETRQEVILNDCNFSIHRGDRILLLGPSGSGKSTLVALLSGLRTPKHGRLALSGMTEDEIGERAWRKRIVAAPQFHENHIFTESFAFNLLMGRQWPPTVEDLRKAEEICTALGLDRLLEEMPGGMFQFVGETGWQLSHGEKSRVYIARALLQGADIVILDESFSALDAGNLRQSLECAMEHAPTLVVVAHP